MHHTRSCRRTPEQRQAANASQHHHPSIKFTRLLPAAGKGNGSAYRAFRASVSHVLCSPLLNQRLSAPGSAALGRGPVASECCSKYGSCFSASEYRISRYTPDVMESSLALGSDLSKQGLNPLLPGKPYTLAPLTSMTTHMTTAF
jgi:hypothetical protein